MNLDKNMKRYIYYINNKIKCCMGKKANNVSVSKDGMIRYYNWWKIEDIESIWFTRFIRKHFPQNKEIINFFSVFGNQIYVRNKFKGKKIFFSGENLDRRNSILKKWYRNIEDYCLDSVDLSLGFPLNPLNPPNYMRFPLWILYLFPPESTFKDISNIIDSINASRYKKKYECALIASHDIGGTRNMIYKECKKIFDVHCAGRWKQNSDELWIRYKNNKILYLRNFKFNICPENSNTEYYVTEKLFEAFLADSIPIYYGANGDPEPNIINKNAVVIWDDSDKINTVKLLLDLKNNPKLYREFINQPKFSKYANEIIFEKFEELRQRIDIILMYSK